MNQRGYKTNCLKFENPYLIRAKNIGAYLATSTATSSGVEGIQVDVRSLLKKAKSFRLAQKHK